jgi:hypothetical protein
MSGVQRPLDLLFEGFEVRETCASMYTDFLIFRIQSEWRFAGEEQSNLPKLFHVEHIHSVEFSCDITT